MKMIFDINTDVSLDSNLPGLYVSDKGSFMLVPQPNVTDKGNAAAPSGQVAIWDVDSGRFIIKAEDKVRGTYTFVADLKDVVVSLAG